MTNTTTFRVGHVISFRTQTMGGMRNLDVSMPRGDGSGVENGVVWRAEVPVDLFGRASRGG